MELKLNGRNYESDSFGSAAEVSGAEAMLQRALFTLRVRRGAFAPLPDFGSRLHLLQREKPSDREAVARGYVQEALSALEGLYLDSLSLQENADSSLTLQLSFTYKGDELDAELLI